MGTTRIAFIAMKGIVSTGRRSKERWRRPSKVARNAEGASGRDAHNVEQRAGAVPAIGAL